MLALLNGRDGYPPTPSWPKGTSASMTTCAKCKGLSTHGMDWFLDYTRAALSTRGRAKAISYQ